MKNHISSYLLKTLFTMLFIVQIISSAVAEVTFLDTKTDGHFMYAVSEGYAWIIDAEDRIGLFTADRDDFKTYEFPLISISHINASEDSLYVNYWHEASQHLMQVDKDGEILWEAEIDSSLNIHRFIVVDGIVFIVGNYAEYHDTSAGFDSNYRLFISDLSEMDIKECNIAGNIIALDSMNNNKELAVLTNNEEGYFVNIYSIEDGSVIEEYAVPWLDYSAIADNGGNCYLLAGSDVYKLSYENGIVTLHKQFDAEIFGLDNVNDYIVTADYAGNRLIYFPVAGDEKTQKLVIANATQVRDRRMDAAVEKFNEKYPDVEICFVDIGSEQLSAMLMSGESDIDILYVSNYTLPVYRESGAICDLYSHSGLMTAMTEWYEMPYLYKAGVYHVPTMVFPLVLCRNEEFDILSEFAYPYSWNELFEYGRNLLDITGTPLISDRIRFPVVVDQYMAYCCINGIIDFDTPLFRELISGYKKAYEDGVIVEMGEDAYFIVTNASAYPHENSYYPLPQIEGTDVNTASIYALAVVSDSNMSDAAMDFLAYYAAVDTQGVINYDAPGAGLIADIGIYEHGSYEVSKTDEMLWGTLINSCVCLPNNVDFSIYMGDQIEAYMRDEITLDELIDRLSFMYEMTVSG